MKRDFLKNLGIEDKELIDKILDENSADIGRAKGEVETLRTKVTELEGQITSKDTEITTLKGQVSDTTTLNEKIRQLETDKTNLTNDLNTKVHAIRKSHAIEGGIRDAKGKNVKAIMALLDEDKITYDENGVLSGLTEQLTVLSSAEDSAMLFGETQQTPPAGTRFNNPPANGGNNPPTSKSFAEAVAKAFAKQ